jgi:hypothetical protein
MKRGPYQKVPLEERFWRYASPCPNTGCWWWAGTVQEKRPGHSDIRGVLNIDYRPVRASRVAFELYNGPITDGLFVCHTCDNSLCVNPDHLFLGTNGDNMRDCVAKGRLRPHAGARRSAELQAKLNVDDVRAIRASIEPSPALALRYGVTGTLIRRVRSGKAWKHVD